MNKYIVLLFVLFVIAYAYMMMEPDKPHNLNNPYNYTTIQPIYYPQQIAYVPTYYQQPTYFPTPEISPTVKTNKTNSPSHSYTDLNSYNPSKNNYYAQQYNILDKNLK